MKSGLRPAYSLESRYRNEEQTQASLFFRVNIYRKEERTQANYCTEHFELFSTVFDLSFNHSLFFRVKIYRNEERTQASLFFRVKIKK